MKQRKYLQKLKLVSGRQGQVSQPHNNSMKIVMSVPGHPTIFIFTVLPSSSRVVQSTIKVEVPYESLLLIPENVLTPCRCLEVLSHISETFSLLISCAMCVRRCNKEICENSNGTLNNFH